MTRLNLAHHRLHSQRMSAAPLKKPSKVVGWLGAVQSQDYAGAKWALGLRMQGATDDDIEINLFTRLTKAENRAVALAAQRYGEFLGMPVGLV